MKGEAGGGALTYNNNNNKKRRRAPTCMTNASNTAPSSENFLAKKEIIG